MAKSITFDSIAVPTLDMACDGVAAFKSVATATDANFAKLGGYQFSSYMGTSVPNAALNAQWVGTTMNAWQTIPANLIAALAVPTVAGQKAFLLEVGGEVNNDWEVGVTHFGVRVTGAAIGADYEPEHSAIGVKYGLLGASRFSVIPIITPGTPVTFTPRSFVNTPANFVRYGYYRIMIFGE